MKMQTKNVLPKFIIATSLLTILFLFIGIFAVKKAYDDVPNLSSQIEEALQSHFNTNNIHLSISRGFDGPNGFVNQSEQIFPLPIDKIDVQTFSSSVPVHRVQNVNHIRIKYSEPSLKISAANKILSIQQAEGSSSQIESIEVPESFQGEIRINSISGEISVDDLSAQNMTLHTVSGDIFAENIKARDVLIETVSGDVELKNLASQNLTVKTVSGDVHMAIRIGEHNPYAFDIKTASGDIVNAFKNLPAGPSPVSINTMSGSVVIESL